VTGFFVVCFSILWFLTTRYYEKPKEHVIVVYDVFGNKILLDGIKTRFMRRDVASNFIKEYQNRFPQYSFNFETYIPEIRRKTIFHKLINFQR